VGGERVSNGVGNSVAAIRVGGRLVKVGGARGEVAEVG